MKLSKKLIGLMLVLSLGGAIVGCSSDKVPEKDLTIEELQENENTEQEDEDAPDSDENKPAETTSLSASELYNKVVTSDLDLPSLVEMDSQFFADVYGIDTSLLKSYKVNMPMMMVHASEIAVFELNNASDAQKVMDGITKRVSGLKAQWESYLPEQLKLVNNYKTATKGNYIIFVVSEHTDTIINNFNANVK